MTQAAYSPGRSTTELVFTFKILAEKAVCADNYFIHRLMLDMSRAFNTIELGTLLHDLSETLHPDELHLVSLLLKDIQLQVKYSNTTGKIFVPDIGSPQGDCASPIGFIFYLYKALNAAKSRFEHPRSITLDIKHDHPCIKDSSLPGYIYQDHPYIKTVKCIHTAKGQNSFLIDQQYADDTSWATSQECERKCEEHSTKRTAKKQSTCE